MPRNRFASIPSRPLETSIPALTCRKGSGPNKYYVIGEVCLDPEVHVVQWVTKPRRWLSVLSSASTPIQDDIIRLFLGSSLEGFFVDPLNRGWFGANLPSALRRIDG